MSIDHYLSHFKLLENRLTRNGEKWLQGIRKEAISSFAALGFPTSRDEAWKYTNLSPLTKVPFVPAFSSLLDGIAGEKVKELLARVPGGVHLVFVNGHYSQRLSLPLNATASPPREILFLGSLADAIRDHPDLVKPHLARHADSAAHPFTALNTAFMTDGAFVYVPDGITVREPVHLLFLSVAHGEPVVSHPRNLIVTGRNSQVTIVESYAGISPSITLTNAVTEVVVGEGGSVDHYKLQEESLQAFHMAEMQVHQSRESAFSSISVSLGGALTRNFTGVLLDAEGSLCTLNGLYLLAGEQHGDNYTMIDHARPRCTSRENYKGILDGRSRGVFAGKVLVRPNAQKTNASQSNKNLILSEDAVVNGMPHLQICADDVKCSHGEAVGQLEEEALFYLRSRGLALLEARALLTYAFAREIIDQIKLHSIRERLEAVILTRFTPLGGSGKLEEAL